MSDAFEKRQNELIADIAHDLNAPIANVSGIIDAIIDGAISADKQEQYLHIASTEMKRLSRLVNQLLEISRIESGTLKLNYKSFDICEMCRLILISFEQKIDQKNLIVEFNSDYNNMYVYADQDAIYQVFIIFAIMPLNIQIKTEGYR